MNCPYCDHALSVDAAAAEARRMRCSYCRVRFDLRVLRAPDESGRSFGAGPTYVGVRSDEEPPPPTVTDLSGDGTTRHVRIKAPVFFRVFMAILAMLVGTVGLSLLVLVGGIRAVLLAFFIMLPVAVPAVVTRLYVVEQITIDAEALACRSSLFGIARTIRVPIAEITGWSYGSHSRLYVRRRHGRPLRLGVNVDVGVRDAGRAVWLKKHLEDGVRLAHERRADRS